MTPLRIIFMGTPGLAAVSLQALLRTQAFQIVAVATQPDRPKGRDLKLQPSPVKELALSAGLPVLQPLKAREDTFVADLRALEPDLVAVAAFGQILPPSILDLPHLGCLNVHTSLLPKYRGAAPIQWAIANGETETGVTIMKMDAGLDTGDILTQRTTPIHPADNGETLHDRLAYLGAELLVATIPDYAAGKIQPRRQEAALATHTAKIKKEDGRIDWRQPATTIWNRLRAFTPWPGTFTFLPMQSKPQLLKIWQAEFVSATGEPGTILAADKSGILVGCGEGALKILVLQREGGRRLTAGEFLAGHPVRPGQPFCRET
jgi:methionyl-tRNA formyltransferase